MHEETGIVQKIDNDWAWVLTRRKDACGKCQHKGHCHIVDGMDKMIVKAKKTGNVVPGDEVALYMSTKTKFKGMFILYIVPVLGVLLGAFSARTMSNLLHLNHNIGMVLFTLLGLTVAFVSVRIYSSRLEKKGALTPRISRVMRHKPHRPHPLKPGEGGGSCGTSYSDRTG